MVRNKDRLYEGFMLRDDEERKGSRCRTKWHIEIKMHLGKQNFLLQHLESIL